MKNRFISSCVAMLAVGAAAADAYARNPIVEDSLKSREDISVFYQALVDTGVIEELKEGEDYTIFAPTNDAFKKISRDKYPCFYSSECKKEVTQILRNHIVPGAIFVETTRPHSLYSINNERPIQLASPHRNNYSIDGNDIIYTMSFRSGILYKIDGVIADRTELSALTRVSTQETAAAPAGGKPAGESEPVEEADADAEASSELAPAGR